MKKKVNHIALVLDDSGSMSGIANEARKAFNAIVREIKDQALATGQETRVTLIYFGYGVETKYTNVGSDAVREIDYYHPNQGGTDLWGGVGEAIDRIANNGNILDDNSFLVITVTDGGHNQHGRWPQHRLASEIRDRQATDRWTFTFQVPRGATGRITAPLGVPAGNVREWDQTDEGTREVLYSASVGTQSYFNARTMGATKVDNFYRTTDLSGVTSRDLQQKLVDVSAAFRQYSVDKECGIQSFVEYKTGTPYVIGSGYYQLMKTETVQPQKRVLVMEKGKKAVYTGDAARDLVGIPRNTTCKLTPGNHANFDLFIQSTSVNRKLPRGTKVMVDRTHTQHNTPTWDHVAAQQAALDKLQRAA